MNGYHYVGTHASAFQAYNNVGPITGIALIVDDENEYRAGNDTGYVMEIECPYGSQTMANNLLASLSNFTYKGYRAQDAILDLDAELGDAITVNGIFSMLAYRSLEFGPGHMSEIAAPGDNELEHEYPYISSTQKEFNRQEAKTYSLITKTAEQIRLEVRNDLDKLSASIDIQLQNIRLEVKDDINDLSASIDLSLDKITSEVKGIDGQVSTLEQTASSLTSRITNAEGDISEIEQTIDSITLEVSNGANSSQIKLMVDGIAVSSKTIEFTGDVVFKSDLEDGVTVISGDNITTGQVSAEFIKLGGQMEIYERLSENAGIGGYFGYTESADANWSTTYGIALQDYTQSCEVIVTDGGARLSSPSASVTAATGVTLMTDYHVLIQANNLVSIYGSGLAFNDEPIVASDKRRKTDIQYDVDEKYLTLFDHLRPCSFLRVDTGDVRHLGFIAQDIRDSFDLVGLDKKDWPILAEANGYYGLRDGELIPILVAKIKQLEKEIQAWKN